jgi:fructose-1,6-bisphosphatase/inositol monophosphatase family enzyme
MEMKNTYMDIGPVNGPITGIVMKEMVRRAIEAIRNQKLSFEVQSKMGYSGTMDDLFTTADTAAQEVYLRTIRECFPNVGIIAEEDSLMIEPKNGTNAYFTIDPLDGTRAFVRGQSHGVGSMIALVIDGQVSAAYVADTNTMEIYGFRPGSDKVHRITEFNIAQQLLRQKGVPLSEGYVLLRDPERVYSHATQKLLDDLHFKSHLIEGASIGIWLARLWKGEVAAAIMAPGYETPWDSTPIIGISQKLGFKFLRPSKLNGRWEVYEPVLPKEKFRRDHDTLIVHESDLPDLNDLID